MTRNDDGNKGMNRRTFLKGVSLATAGVIWTVGDRSSFALAAGASAAEGARWQPAIDRAVMPAATTNRITTDSPGRMLARSVRRQSRAGIIDRPFVSRGG